MHSSKAFHAASERYEQQARRRLARRSLQLQLSGPQGEQYGIIVDAGSTGTRLRIFHYMGTVRRGCQLAARFSRALCLPPHIRELRPPSEEGSRRLRTRPGLSAFANTPELAAKQVADLVHEATLWIPKSAQSETLLFICATAGLRLLPIETSSRLLDAVGSAMRDKARNPFRFVEARIISGEEEAVFGWLTINYLLGNLDGEQGTQTQYAGWIDLGGASEQVAHTLPESSSGDDGADSESVRLPTGEALVFRHSHLRFGREEAFGRSCRLLARDAQIPLDNSSSVGNRRIEHPCLLRGDTLQLDRFGRPSPSPTPPFLTVVGSGDSDKCAALVARLVNIGADCGARCGRPPAPFHGTLYGGGNYYWTAVQLGLASSGGQHNVTPALYLNAASEFCTRSTREVMLTSEGSLIPWRHARFGCFAGMYISTLLQRAHDVSDLSSPIAITSNIHGTAIDWTLGALLHELTLKQYAHSAPDVRVTFSFYYWLREPLAVALPSSCRQLVENGLMPYWCLVPLGWALALAICAWVVGCASCFSCLRRAGVFGRARSHVDMSPLAPGEGSPTHPVSNPYKVGVSVAGMGMRLSRSAASFTTATPGYTIVRTQETF